MSIYAKQDPNIIRSKANSSWQQRISTPKGNPNAPRTDFSKLPNYDINSQYESYCQQCLASGQTPMSMLQYMQQVSSGVDPLATLNTTQQTGSTVSSLMNGVLGLFGIGKSSKAEAGGAATGKGPTETQQQMVNNYKAALQSGGEFTVDNLNGFVNAEFAHMNATGDTVTQEQFINYMTNLGYDEAEAVVIANAMDTSNSDFSSDKTISKKELTSFYKSVMGNSNSISAQKIEAALTAHADKTDNAQNNDEVTNAMKAKGYTSTTKMIDGEITGVFVKGEEVIPWTDTDKIAQIIDGTGE